MSSNLVIRIYRIILKDLHNSNNLKRNIIKHKMKKGILLNKDLSGKQKEDSIDGLLFHMKNICTIEKK
jgi:hypothetical protein